MHKDSTDSMTQLKFYGDDIRDNLDTLREIDLGTKKVFYRYYELPVGPNNHQLTQ